MFARSRKQDKYTSIMMGTKNASSFARSFVSLALSITSSARLTAGLSVVALMSDRAALLKL